ncbi:putative NADH-flavin reductase [Actinoplanes octamycinicus]|uniref:Putative NADH-flavin reductase n=1 Tax=Actinoplanes octamycinicus TaxID=135948 RepID=A0A7W7GY62_9ACTN|nr:NAD(P)H-binding protein [Actinoplanes octamycinicus]MBB4740468.1 putative NADH-flavin reductase [Actinoplanes octamycinicus]GIE59729.1 NADH-flavin reductase [Actinoplanes octamycinicus]
MKITVFGASGRTGTQVVRQACEEGHEVTAVVRDPARLAFADPRLRVVRAELDDAGAIAAAVAGRDAAISALGPRGRGPTTVCSDGVAAIMTAMRAHGVRRLVVVSNSGMHVDGEDGAFTRHLVKPLLMRVLAHGYADMRRMEDLVMASELDWTVVRPPMLTNGPRTGAARMAFGRNLRGGRTVSRADLADRILYLLTDGYAMWAPVAVAA